MTTRLAFAVMVLAGISACAKKSSPVAASVSVTDVAPAPDAQGVGLGDTLRMSLDMPMDSASFATRFALHMSDSAGPTVPGHVLFGSGYRQMMFVPHAPLAPGTMYVAMMRDSVTMHGSGSATGMNGMMTGGTPMLMNGTMPSGARRMHDGMGWAFTTRN